MTERELFEEYKSSGSNEAFEELVDRYAVLVHSACLRVLGDRHAAEDAAQAAFLMFARKAHKLPEQTNLASWLFHAATNTALNQRRADIRRARYEQEAAAMRAASSTPESEIWSDVRPLIDELVAALPKRQQDAVILRYLMGKSEADIAAELGCPRGTASAWLSRGLAALREKLRHRGVVVPAAMLATFLAQRTAEAVQAGNACWMMHGTGASRACLGGRFSNQRSSRPLLSGSGTSFQVPLRAFILAISVSRSPYNVRGPSSLAWG